MRCASKSMGFCMPEIIKYTNTIITPRSNTRIKILTAFILPSLSLVLTKQKYNFFLEFVLKKRKIILWGLSF
jgi:hypothetical protein